MFPGIESILADVNASLAGLLAQAADTALESGDAVVGEAGEPELTFMQRLLSNPFLLPIGMVVIFYLTFLAPDKRKRQEEAKLMASLSKNDRVVTVGGIHGTIVSASPDSDVLTLKIDEGGNVRIKVNRSAIATKVESTTKNKEKSATDKT